MTAIYDRHSYDKEKQLALEAWSTQLKTLVDGQLHANVANIYELKQAI